MTFLEDARNYLREVILPQLEGRLAQEEYIHRFIFREGVDVHQVITFRQLLLQRGSANDLLDDRELAKKRDLLLIGNAGSGKSFVLIFGYIQATRRFLGDSSAPFPLFLELGSGLPHDLDIERALDSKYDRFFRRALTEHPSGCALFLDSLDEVLRISRLFINDLEQFLQAHRPLLKQVVVACRRPAWSPDWFSRDPIKLPVYHVDYLGDEVYSQILQSATDRRRFFEHCASIGISALLDTPFDGFYLAREFRAGRSLPRTRRECVDLRITKALRGTETDSREAGAPPLDRLRFLGRQLACIGSFTLNSAWTLQEAIDQLGSSRLLKSDQPVEPKEAEALLQRPLFRKDGRRFAFVHEIYREYLCAEALFQLSLRKQRQLLEVENPRFHRIRTPCRGIAVSLVELSEHFRQYLIDSDPLVAFFSELPFLPPEQDEALLHAVINDAITDHRAPWWEIPPRGERPLNALPKHRPHDVAVFLRPHLEAPDEIARLWGTACAQVWGGAEALNNTLDRLAHDTLQHLEIRKSAVAAIAATKNLGAVRALYDLFDDQDDQVRGEVLRAHRQLDSPSPRDFVARLRGGSRDRSLYCLLQLEAEAFGSTLETSQLAEAFQAVDDNFERLRDLRSHILNGLLRRATELRFAAVPPSLIVKCWTAREFHYSRHEESVNQLLRAYQTLFEKVWNHVMDLLGRGEGSLSEFELSQHLGEVCSDFILDLLPREAGALNDSQERLISLVLAGHFSKQASAERLALFQCRAPAFAQYLRLPRPQKSPLPKDPLEEKQNLVKALSVAHENPIAQTLTLLRAIAEMEHGTGHQQEVTEDDVLRVLARMAPMTRKQILKIFRGCVAQVGYERRKTGPSQFSMTRPEFEIPFWVLRSQGEHFEPQKIAEIVQCYGLMDSVKNARYKELLEELRQHDRETWQRIIFDLLENGTISIHGPIKYLIEVEESLYLGRCSERLAQGLFDRTTFDSLVEYLLAFRSPGYHETLRTCYCLLRDHMRGGSEQWRRQDVSGEGIQGGLVQDGQESSEASSSHLDLSEFPNWDQFGPLILLMSEDDDWAWSEFSRRLGQEDVPLQEDFLLRLPPRRFPSNPLRLPILADWYALVRRRTTDENFQAADLARHLLESIVAIDGGNAIRELQRLQRTCAFPDALWLSHAILRIEDRLLSEGAPLWESGTLLDFVNKENLAVVLSERDLFEWVCQALEEIKRRLEQQAEGVAGFWNEDQPKMEPECQNVLWPLLRLALQRLGIVEVEEKFIGPNKCDFWIEYPRPSEDSFRVAVELKTARLGYGPRELIDPVETQLWEKYLRPSGVRHGIFIELWFCDDKRYRGPEHWTTKDSLVDELRGKCEAVAMAHDLSLASYVIDVTTPFRRH